MTSVVESSARADVRTIVWGGVRLGVVTAIGVVVFALASRALTGTAEFVVQSVLVLLGGALFAYLPAVSVRPNDVDSIGWAALLGLLGALAFTVIDTVVLRPLGIYHWTWDAIGGGSGFWYVPVWWMVATVIAWLGSWVAAIAIARGTFNLMAAAGQTIAIALILFAVLVFTKVASVHAATMALDRHGSGGARGARGGAPAPVTAGPDGRRRWRIVAWLLTPIVVWAASFFGGWVGAIVARDTGQAVTGPLGLGLGAIVGGGVGVALCLITLRGLRRRKAAIVEDD